MEIPKQDGNKLTPRLETIRIPDASWICVDIGIWKAHTPDAHMTMMTYMQLKPGHWRPVAGRLDTWELVLKAQKELWNKYACPACHGVPKSECPHCDSRGWKDWNKWLEKGAKLDDAHYPIL